MARTNQLILSVLLASTAGGLIFAFNNYQPPTVETALPPPAKENQPTAQSFSAPGESITEPTALADFSEMITRPLFSADRRPLSPANGEQPEIKEPLDPRLTGPVEKSQFLVMGIIITEAAKVALLKETKAPKEVIKVREGQKISDWTVDSITPEHVLISKRGITDRIRLSDNVLSAAQKRRLIQLSKQTRARQARKRPPVKRTGVSRSKQPTSRGSKPAQRVQPAGRINPAIKTQVR